jgi:hypothetical protein
MSLLLVLLLIRCKTGAAKTIWNLTFTKLNIFIYFTYETNSIHFSYYVGDASISLRILTVGKSCVTLNSKLYFHCHIDNVYSQARRMLGLIRYVAYICFFFTYRSLILYNAFKSELQNASVVKLQYNLTLPDCQHFKAEWELHHLSVTVHSVFMALVRFSL